MPRGAFSHAGILSCAVASTSSCATSRGSIALFTAYIARRLVKGEIEWLRA